MSFLYAAHSGLRYLVLLSALVALVVLVRGLSTGAPYGRPSRIASASFVGFLNLQGLLGIGMILMGVWYTALIGHITLMVLAIGAAQTLTAWAKKAEDSRQAHRYALAGVGLALLLVMAGIAAIGRHPLESRAFLVGTER